LESGDAWPVLGIGAADEEPEQTPEEGGHQGEDDPDQLHPTGEVGPDDAEQSAEVQRENADDRGSSCAADHDSAGGGKGHLVCELCLHRLFLLLVGGFLERPVGRPRLMAVRLFQDADCVIGERLS
jgi:hypothetical protein